MNLKDFQENNTVDENLWKNKMYEIHSVINDILFDAERGKISWKDACYQAKAETSDLDEIEEMKEYKETIVISKETAEELDNLLDLEDIDFEERQIAKDSTIEIFTANFKNGYSMGIKVCAGEHNCFLDVVLFNENSSQVDYMYGEDTVLGTFEFEDEDENVRYITEIVVGKLFEIEVDKDSLNKAKKLLSIGDISEKEQLLETNSFINIGKSPRNEKVVSEFELFFDGMSYELGISLFDARENELSLFSSLENIEKEVIDEILTEGEKLFEIKLRELQRETQGKDQYYYLQKGRKILKINLADFDELLDDYFVKIKLK